MLIIWSISFVWCLQIFAVLRGQGFLDFSGKEKNTSYQVRAGSKVTERMTPVNEWRID